jgi:hypothetical protein
LGDEPVYDAAIMFHQQMALTSTINLVISSRSCLLGFSLVLMAGTVSLLVVERFGTRGRSGWRFGALEMRSGISLRRRMLGDC